MTRIWIGTSGYSYTDWVGPFYPPGTTPRRMLAYYCQQFPLVELNFTFYRSPTAEQLARIGDQVPAGFQFLVKLPKTATHEGNDQDLPGFRRAVEELQRRDKLAGLLCQLPQAFHESKANRARLEFLAAELGDLALAVEFRHRSWQRPDVVPWMRERGLEVVAVDAPDLPGLYPSGLVQSGPRVYVRFHSRLAENWYASDKDRYDYDYGDDELVEWVDALAAGTEPTSEVRLLFNNCHRGQAAENARRMRTLIERLAPQFEVVPPMGTPEPGTTQRLLFE